MLQLVGLDVQQGSLGQIAEFVSSIFMAIGVRPALITVLGIYVLIISLQAVLRYWQTTTNMDLQYMFVVRLRQQLYRAIANSNWLFLSRSRSSDFTHALTTELDRVGMATHHLLLLVTSALVTSVYLVLALQVSAAMTGLVFVCGVGLLLLLRGKMQASRVTGKDISVATRGLYSAAIEHLGGIKTIKSHGAEDRNVDIFSRLAKHVAHIYITAIRSQAQVKLWSDVGLVLTLSIIVYVSSEVLAIPTAGLLLLLFLFARTMPKLSGLQQSYQHLTNMLPAFATVAEMQARCEAAAEPKTHEIERIELRNSIRLEQVSFGYEEGNTTAIHDLDLIIRAGETTAIVGPSGAGKSTVADLVLGLVMPNRGRVLVDDVMLSADKMRAWRDRIGYVAQDTFLFHDTIRANLLWVQPDASAEDIQQALGVAAAEEFISQLPEGLETVLGDRGIRLSGGERQRLALARALLRKPSLLILDEATSNLDFENERRIQSAIEDLRGQMTILVITHRLSTVRDVDVIHVLEQGCLVESGTLNTLITKENGRFRTLWYAEGRGSDQPKDYPVLAGPIGQRERG
jgi:ATP-binding cassette subfamily C protein